MAKKINVRQIEGNATQQEDGLMSSSDKTKLDNLEDVDKITNSDIDQLMTN